MLRGRLAFALIIMCALLWLISAATGDKANAERFGGTVLLSLFLTACAIGFAALRKKLSGD